MLMPTVHVILLRHGGMESMDGWLLDLNLYEVVQKVKSNKGRP